MYKRYLATVRTWKQDTDARTKRIIRELRKKEYEQEILREAGVHKWYMQREIKNKGA